MKFRPRRRRRKAAKGKATPSHIECTRRFPMIYFLTSLPLWLSGLLVVVLPTALAMLGPALIRRHITLERLTTNNEVAGFKFAAVAVLYAVLLAFAVIVVWERFSEAKSNVTKEAGAAATIYRLSQGISGEPGMALRAALTNYLKATISDDWPAMERVHASASNSTNVGCGLQGAADI